MIVYAVDDAHSPHFPLDVARVLTPREPKAGRQN
jgi:hypothetical protein